MEIGKLDFTVFRVRNPLRRYRAAESKVILQSCTLIPCVLTLLGVESMQTPEVRENSTYNKSINQVL